MQLAPRYDATPIVSLDGPPSGVLAPTARQWRRFVDVLSAFDEAQWSHPSRCEGWSNRDVIVHLESAAAFWGFSVVQGVNGEPTRFLATFDPVASPAAMVRDARDRSSAEVLERFVRSTEGFLSVLEGLDESDWESLAESPPGHVTVASLAHHALWDSWVHERDVLIPLGVDPVVEADEVVACLRYAAALSPAFAVNNGAVGGGRLVVDATDPAVRCIVDVGTEVRVRTWRDDDAVGDGDLVLTGSSVDMVEALSMRRPLGQDVPAATAWMVDGLAEVFDTPSVAQKRPSRGASAPQNR